MVDPLSYFSLQSVLHNWYIIGHVMCYPVCGIVHIKYPLLLIKKRIAQLVVEAGFLSLSEWLFTICLALYNHKIKCVECVIK